VLRAFPLCTCCRHYPGTATRILLHSFTQSYQPSPIWLSDRPVQRPFRGLLSVHSRYGLHTRAVTLFCDTLHPRLQPFRYLHSCSGCFRLERSPGRTFTYWKTPPFHGARHKQSVYKLPFNCRLILKSDVWTPPSYLK